MRAATDTLQSTTSVQNTSASTEFREISAVLGKTGQYVVPFDPDQAAAALRHLKIDAINLVAQKIALFFQGLVHATASSSMIFYPNTSSTLEYDRLDTNTVTAQEANVLDGISLKYPDLSIILQRVANLLIEEETDEDNEFVPAVDTVIDALDIILEARRLSQLPFPRAAASTDGYGAVLLYWRKPGVSLRFSVAPSGTSIYHSDGDGYALEKDCTAADLKQWIEWFRQHDSTQ